MLASVRNETLVQTTEEQLKEFLTRNGVNYSSWGRWGSRSLSSLVEEINEGESRLISTNNGVVRDVQSALIDLYFQNGEKRFWLESETHREKIRSNEHTISGKIQVRFGESPEEGAYRELKEELGFTGIVLLKAEAQEVTPRVKPSHIYPGLQSVIQGFLFTGDLTHELYVPHGYVNKEIKDGVTVTTYFKWKEV